MWQATYIDIAKRGDKIHIDDKNTYWLMCPICENKTRTKARQDTVMSNFPLFCPKCNNEVYVNVHQLNVTVIELPQHKLLNKI